MNIYIYICYGITNNYQHLQKSQNMNYGNIRIFSIFSNMSKMFWHCGSILYNKSLFRISYSDSLYFSVYGNKG